MKPTPVPSQPHTDEDLLSYAIALDSIVCGVEAAKAKSPDELCEMIKKTMDAMVLENIIDVFLEFEERHEKMLDFSVFRDIVGSRYGDELFDEIWNRKHELYHE